ncbi:MAG TPA: UDP-3-O-acyl-N-acetylglucosamine deacetylase [Acetobacteraceae bacterium]|nr:UDP-3-O-acyl-N-acetylglucosamine deacetylase [Acetobacteraceae bacterium]
MDGLPIDALRPARICQQTLKSSIGCVGVGLHTGLRVAVTLRPAVAGHGIVFRRTDLGREIPARFDRVVEARLSTAVVHPHDPAARVGTIEHVMAALAGTGIDNVLVELDGPELPILDGSSSPFVFLIDCAGIAEQDAPRPVIEMLRRVRVADGDAWVELRPAAADGFHMELSIDFAATAIGRQSVSLRLTPESFRHQLCRARTFALAEEIEQLRAAGLARGGSLKNAVVVDRDRILNPGGLRMADEFARHKLLDAVGDLALLGAGIRGRFRAHRSGHALNNRLLRALTDEPSSWRFASAEALSAAA